MILYFRKLVLCKGIILFTGSFRGIEHFENLNDVICFLILA